MDELFGDYKNDEKKRSFFFVISTAQKYIYFLKPQPFSAKKNSTSMSFLINQIANRGRKTTFSTRIPKRGEKNDEKKRSFLLS